ncbi:metallophosphoesterase [Xenophilus arseniciresistens]|uniref:Metallophosphoesterase n=1 Tax=Xenophilus arseniciresistens TaxID=1283306 RepID=A0AAE3N8Z0_9BURK|nr:metallophosphoesterase [Xenophilus arseniciresistens]MDA7417008.1 metallophosphoesterase [Xenophilus arseniciresistens]
MSVLIQISDTHFGTEQPAVVEALVHWVRAQAPDVLLLTGDITQRATRAQFAAARAFLDRLQVPHTLVIPGNHDIPLYALGARLFTPYGRFEEAFGTQREPVLDRADCLVQALNTTRWWRHEDGELSAGQIETVARRLQAARPGQLRVVAVHQPLVVTRPEDRSNLLHGHARARERWAQAGVDLVLGGHIHLPFAAPLGARGTAWAVQAGTAVSSRVRAGAPNSVNLIRGPLADAEHPRHCLLERWDFTPGSAGFVAAEVRKLPLQVHA